MAEALPPVFDAARDVTWLGGERKPEVDGVLRSYGRQIREMAQTLGVRPSDFVVFSATRAGLSFCAFVPGSYEAIHAKAALNGFHVLNENEVTLLAPQLGQLQDPDKWSFLESPEAESTGWASAIRFVGESFVQHNRSTHGDSPFCGAWVFKSISK